MTETSTTSDGSTLVAGARQLGVELSPDAAASMVRYLDHFYSWNDYAGFTSIDRRDGVRLHLLDSLSIAPELAAARSITDLGSGGGMPGIPLAISLPDARVTLVESKRRRCSFLREAIRQLDLQARVTVEERDATQLAPGVPPDAVIARAFLPPAELLALASTLLRTDGLLIIMAGGRRPDWADIAHPAFELLHDRSLVLPESSDDRRIVVGRRRSNCFT